jgi:hypothetical protein
VFVFQEALPIHGVGGNVIGRGKGLRCGYRPTGLENRAALALTVHITRRKPSPPEPAEILASCRRHAEHSCGAYDGFMYFAVVMYALTVPRDMRMILDMT